MSEASVYKAIATCLRGLREALDFDLAAMAAELDVSEEKVALYESGQEEIPVSYLSHVARTCHIGLTVLLTGQEAHLHSYSLVRKDKGLNVERRRDYDYKNLAYRFVGRKIEPFLVTVPCREEDEVHFCDHAGQEFIYMLKGRLEVFLGDQRHILNPGDSLYFSSEIPHGLRRLDNQPAEFLDVIL